MTAIIRLTLNRCSLAWKKVSKAPHDMSYEVVRTHLVRCRRHAEENGEAFVSIVDALEQLTNAVESDLTQIKVALSHIARLSEQNDND